MANLSIEPGDNVLEAGTGSGLMTILLSQGVQNNGKINTYDKRHKTIAPENYERWNQMQMNNGHPMLQNVTFNNESVKKAADFEYDLIYLDLPHLIDVIEDVVANLKSGKCIFFYAPSISRIYEGLAYIDRNRIPLLLEEVWEETDLTWKLKHGKLLSPRCNEFATVFVSKFRKCKRPNDIHSWENLPSYKETSHNDSNIFPLKGGDTVIVSPVTKYKKVKHYRHLLRLDHSKKFNSSLGIISHGEILQQECGTIMKTSSGTEIYAYKPMQVEMAEMTETLQFSSRTYRLAGYLMSLKNGASVMHIGKPSNLFAITFGILYQNSQITFVNVDTRNANDETSKNYKINQHNCEYGYKICDAVFMSYWNKDLLDRAYNTVKLGGFICMASRSLAKIQDIVDWFQMHKTDADELDLIEDRERKWLVRASNIENTTEYESFTCRPHYKGNPASVYLLRIKKGWQL